MKRWTLFLICAATAWAASAVHAQQMPQIKEMKPGKYSYSIETFNPGMPIKMPALNFQHCVTAKDMEEGRAFQAQRDAGVDCKYSDIKQSASRVQFKAVCNVKGGMTMKGDYDMQHSGDTITGNIRQEMSGGGMPPEMSKSTTKMVMKRTGDC
jgi:hypothetical protein